MVIPTVVLVAMLLQASTPSCSKLDIASDRMGVRVRDIQGNWLYITPSDTELVGVAKVPKYGNIWGSSLLERSSSKLFGPCAPVYSPLLTKLLGFVDFDTSGYKVSNLALARTPFQNRSERHERDSFPSSLTSIQADFYLLNGTDLLVLGDRIYAVDEDGVASLLVSAPAETRERMTGVARQMADAFASKGATKAKAVSIGFTDGKFRAQIEIKGRTKEVLKFAAN
jgi:hypothetical protein